MIVGIYDPTSAHLRLLPGLFHASRLPLSITVMALSVLCQLPLGLLITCLIGVEARPKALHKRDPNYDVLGGANFPDPGIIDVSGTSYVFGTVDGAGHNVPMVSNSDFSNAGGWSAITDAFPGTDVPAMGDGGWAAQMTTWAPDVNQLVCDAVAVD